MLACFGQMLGELVAVDIAQMPVSVITGVFVVHFVFEQDIDVDNAQVVVGDYKPLVVRNVPDASVVPAEQSIAHVVVAVSRALVGNE